MIFQKLQAWQDAENVNDEALASRVSGLLNRRVNRTTIYRAKRGQRVLGMDLQLALQKITKIPPSEWADFYAQTVHLRGEGSRKAQKKSPAAEPEAA